jgi:hypothetical protein
MKQALLALMVCVAAPAWAQKVDVGYPPPASPFRDLEYKHEFTVFGGYYSASKDPAGVAPRSGPMEGIRYELVVGGPVELAVRLVRVNSERRVVNAVEPAATRELGVQSWPIYLSDVGFSINLTGQRSWHGVVPVIYTGVGLASDLGKNVKEDPFKLGTTFAFALAPGLRFVPGGRFQMRADAGAWFYQIKYPSAYYTPASDGTVIVPSNQTKNFWKRNLGLTLGASYLLFR